MRSFLGAALFVLFGSIACGGSTPPASEPSVQPAQVTIPEPAPEPATAPTATQPPEPEPALTEAQPEGLGEITIDGVHFLIRGTAVSQDKGWVLTMHVTATTPPGKEAWLFGLQQGLTLGGRYEYNASVRGGGFGEGGTSTSVHVDGTKPTVMERTYPRNEGDDPIVPGTGVSAQLTTSICEQDSRSACHDVTVATVKIMVPTEGAPTLEVLPGKEIEE